MTMGNADLVSHKNLKSYVYCLKSLNPNNQKVFPQIIEDNYADKRRFNFSQKSKSFVLCLLSNIFSLIS
jgi:hypothetical protein